MPHGRERYRRRPQWWRHRKSRRQHVKQSRRVKARHPDSHQVRACIGAYATALIMFVGTSVLLARTGDVIALPAIGVIYAGCGIGLTKFMHTRIAWARYRGGISAVMVVKLRAIAGWPLSVPTFIVRVAIVRHI